MFRISLLCFIASILVACGNEQKAPPVTPSENLNTLLNAAPITWIDLNDLVVDTVTIPTENIFEDQLFVDESLYLIRPNNLTLFGKDLIATDFGNPNVVVLNKEGIPQQMIGREGRGPGEFERPMSLMTDGTYLYIYDEGLSRISVFDQEYNLLDTFYINDVAHGMSGRNTAVNKNFIAHQSFFATGFTPDNDDAPLLSVKPIHHPDSVHFQAMPRIVPTGMQPAAYNNIIVDITDQNRIVGAFPALPYLFIFDNFDHRSTIALEAVHYDTTENPSLEPFQQKEPEDGRVSSILGEIKLFNNGDLLLSSFGYTHHFKSGAGGEYTYHKSYAFFREDTGDRITPRNLSSSPDAPNIFYAIGWQYLFKVEFDLN